MLSVYVVLDGFDFGVGILHLIVARKDIERQQILSAIGPFWNGNEVWLLAAGGLLVFAFPKVYATGFSGFYLPLVMVLWLLILRGIALEFRSKEENPLWRTLWDNTFCISSLVMTIVLGAALGNVIRGVPLGHDGYFDGALWTNFLTGTHPGILDWYTVSVGLFAALVLSAHGALYLCWKTSGCVADRCRKAAKFLWTAVIIWGIAVTAMTAFIRPLIYENLMSRPWTFTLPALIVVSLAVIVSGIARRMDLRAFLGSALFIVSMLAATAAGMYPNMLISTLDPAYTITADNAAISASALNIGLIWWLPAAILAILYFINLFRAFSGKVEADQYGH